MKRGSSALPCATASNAPIPSFFICALSRTVTRNPCVAATLRACSARWAGGLGAGASDRVARDLGRLPRPDEQDSFRLAGAVDEERLVLLSFVIAGRDGPFETGILEWRDACSRGDDHRQERCLDIQERLG